MAIGPRFYVPMTPGDDEIAVGLRWLLGWVRDHPEESPPLIVAPSKRQLEDIELLAGACKEIECVSERTRHSSRWDRNGPVLLLFPDRRVLGEFDELARGALCAVASYSEPIEYWIRARDAQDVTGRSTPARGELVANPVAREALRSLSVLVNKAYLVNYEDRDMAVLVLRTLQRNGEAFEAHELHAWALADGWSPDAASRLRAIAEGVIAGRRFQLKSGMRQLRSGAIQRWRKAAKERSTG